MTALSPEHIDEAMKALHDDWALVHGHHIECTFTFPDFIQALAFVNGIGALAEAMGHHPDIELGWGRVKISIHTHDIDGLSDRDFRLAGACDELR